MNKHFCLLLLSLLWLPALGQSESAETDSLIAILAQSKEDTSKVNLYRKVGLSLIYQNAILSIPYFKEGGLLAKKLQYDGGTERCYSAVSLAYSFAAKYDTSLLYSDTAIYYVNKTGNPGRQALLYLNRADVYTNLQNLALALKNLDTALHYGEISKNKSVLARIYSVRSDVYASQEKYDPAISSLDQSEVLFREINDRQMLAMTHFCRAEILQAKNELAEAVPFYQLAIAMADSIKDFQNLPSYTSGLAQAFASQKKLAEAEAMGRRSLEYARAIGHRKQEALVYDLFHGIALERKNYPLAIEEELKAYAIMKEEKDLLREQVIANTLSDTYARAGNPAEAYRYLKISHELKDSLVKQQFNDETARLQTMFEVSQKDKEIALLNKDRELQSQKLKQQWFLTAGSFLLVVLALLGIGLLINRNKLRQEMKELELRNRIAADLHDEVGSSISSIHMLSQVAAQQTGEQESQKKILDRMSVNARETMEKMGDIVWMIKPAEKEGPGLIQRMERFIFEMCSSKQIRCNFKGAEIMESVKLSMQQRKNFYLVFKEALNNAVKYAGTDKIDISISRANNRVILSVQDYGKGFVLQDPQNQEGNGLANMQNRARELNGTLSIRSDPENGTLVSLDFPV